MLKNSFSSSVIISSVDSLILTACSELSEVTPGEVERFLGCRVSSKLGFAFSTLFKGRVPDIVFDAPCRHSTDVSRSLPILTLLLFSYEAAFTKFLGRGLTSRLGTETIGTAIKVGSISFCPSNSESGYVCSLSLEFSRKAGVWAPYLIVSCFFSSGSSMGESFASKKRSSSCLSTILGVA